MRGIKSRTVASKAAFNKKKNLRKQTEFKFKEETSGTSEVLHLECSLFGPVPYRLLNVDQK
jgi:hypothetical protein